MRLPHRTDAARDIELQIDDREVVVSYGGEPLHLRDRAFAVQFVEALLGGRMDIEVHHGLLWRTTRSYLDESAAAVPRDAHADPDAVAATNAPGQVGFGAG